MNLLVHNDNEIMFGHMKEHALLMGATISPKTFKTENKTKMKNAQLWLGAQYKRRPTSKVLVYFNKSCTTVRHGGLHCVTSQTHERNLSIILKKNRTSVQELLFG